MNSLSKWKWVLTVMLLAHLSSSVFAEHTEHLSDDSAFRLDKGLVDQIYASSIKEQSEHSRNGNLGIGAGVSLLFPRELSLSNSYYDVSYANAKEVYPMPFVSLGSALATWGWGSVGWSARAGYTYRDGIYTLKLKNGAGSSQDFLRMHWASGLGRLELSVFSASVPWIRPVLFAGLGAQWIFQVGRIDGVNQSFLIPSYASGLELVLFDRTQSGEHWFSGARFGITYLSAFASPQKLSLLGWDFGASFIF